MTRNKKAVRHRTQDILDCRASLDRLCPIVSVSLRQTSRWKYDRRGWWGIELPIKTKGNRDMIAHSKSVSVRTELSEL